MVVRKIISSIFTWNALQNMYSEAQLFNTHSFGTDSLPSEYWITEDDRRIACGGDVMRFRRHGLRSRTAYTLQLLFPSNHGKVLPHFLYGLLQSYSVLHSCLPCLQSFSFSLWQVDAFEFDKWLPGTFHMLTLSLSRWQMNRKRTTWPANEWRNAGC